MDSVEQALQVAQLLCVLLISSGCFDMLKTRVVSFIFSVTEKVCPAAIS